MKILCKVYYMEISTLKTNNYGNEIHLNIEMIILLKLFFSSSYCSKESPEW